jgi:hypothetical protein
VRLTKKQRKVLEVVCRGIKNDDGHRIGWLDAQGICDEVDYKVTIHSMKFTLRFLADKAMVEKGDSVLRRERWVVPIKPTNEAYDYITSRANTREIENEGVVEMFL